MARRAPQGAVARCPWCSASLPQLVVECPECRFPLTMAAADGGLVAEHSGTTSTATPAGRPPGRPLSGVQPPSELARAHSSRAHRIRVGAGVLGLLSVLLLLASVSAVLSTSSPDARGDREATISLHAALHRATDDPGYLPEVPVTTLAGDQPSDLPSRVSTEQASGFWYATARSSSGRCHMLVAGLADGKPRAEGTLSNAEPCNAAHVRSRLEEKLVKSNRR